MKFSIITLFPEVLEPIFNSSILKRAQNKGLVEIELINLRPFGEGSHQIVDDKPYGGGVGMVLKADILAKAVQSVSQLSQTEPTSRLRRTIFTSASGKPFNQQKAEELAKLEHITIVCAHYEAVDHRFIDNYIDEEISIGDYVLTGGEIPTMIIVDSVTRLIKGVLKKEATQKESFSITHSPLSPIHLLEHPHYTRPFEFENEKVPAVLISGNHAEVEKWRQEQSLEKTKKVRPDLLKRINLTDSTGR